MDGSQPINPYLSGNFAPVREESDFDLAIDGALPAELAGAFYRNGPNPQFEPGPDYHWFGGDGMIHAVFVEEGKARYRNRFVQTPKWKLENAAGRRLFATFGNPIGSDPSVIGKDGGTANTNIVWHAGRLFALEEGHPPTDLDPESLETRGYLQAYGGKVTAHPKIDPLTGEMIWFAYMVGEAGGSPFSPTVSYGVTDKTGKVIRRDAFEAPYCSMVHDFLVTEKHVLFPILPLVGSLESVMAGRSPFVWDPAKGAFVGVMWRDAGVETLKWFEVEPNYVFHPMNAWEVGSRLFADVMEYPKAPLFPDADGNRSERAPARLVRWTIDLEGNSNQVKREPLDDLPGEFPRVDDRRACLAYRHGWFAGVAGEDFDARFDCLAHVDLKTGKRSLYRFAAGDCPGEPVFVPRTADAAEGDGFLVALVYRGGEDRSDFVVFEAQDVAAGPIASARIPRRVPFGFHGNWRGA